MLPFKSVLFLQDEGSWQDTKIFDICGVLHITQYVWTLASHSQITDKLQMKLRIRDLLHFSENRLSLRQEIFAGGFHIVALTILARFRFSLESLKSFNIPHFSFFTLFIIG